MTAHVNKDGVNKNIDDIYVKVNGIWHTVSEGYTKVDGSWKEFYRIPPNKPVVGSVSNIVNRPFNNGSVSVLFSLPQGSQPATNYTVTARTAGQTDIVSTVTSSPATLVGLRSNTQYSITVIANNTIYGSSEPSSEFLITVTTVPATPSAPTVTTQVNQDNVSWTAPTNGGIAISNYQWESNDSKGNTTTSTSVAVAQEGGTSQAYRVRAYNTNGWSEWSSYSGTVTTTPPFFPYFPPYFPPFFPFFPFFPYFPPYFPPRFPYFPNFSPLCIAADTLVMTTSGPVAAKDLVIGQKLVSFELAEMGIDSEDSMFSWTSGTLTIGSEPVETEIYMILQKVNKIICFNEDPNARYSNTQPMFVRIGEEYSIKTTGSIPLGSYLIKINEDGTYQEEEVLSIDFEEGHDTTYQINCEPYDWFIAGGYLVHNK